MDRTAYGTVDVNGLSVFYREAGPQDAPAVLLLHGFPSSSRMWQPLLDRLADSFRLVAPDYPGFGHSDAPSHTEFAYTFDHLAAVLGQFTQALGLARYTLVMQDYGGRPRGRSRPAVEDPARVLGRPPGTRGRAAGELLLLRRNAAAPRRNQPEHPELRPGPVDR